MGEIVCLIIFLISIFLFKFIFKINLKDAKKLEENKTLQEVTDRFPENIEIAKEMLEMLNNDNVKIEEAKNTKTSLYIAVTNKILIADLKDNYGRIQTIAHECLHSVQDRTLLVFNFLFSNITIIYWIVTIILTVCNVFTNSFLQISILLLLFFIQTIIRAYLETDAMTKSKYLSKEYIENKKLCTKKEENELVSEYDKINNMGIPFYLYKLTTNSILKIISYLIICIVLKFII